MGIVELVAAVVGETEHWRLRAACLGGGNEVFFVGRGHSIAEAQAVCSRCSVREECLDYAVRTHQRFGVWGGVRATDLRPGRRRAEGAA